MIHDFNDESLLQLWQTGSAARFPDNLATRLLAVLDIMDAVRTLDELKLVPGCKVVPLFPEGEDTMVLPVTSMWHLVFRSEFDVFSGLHAKYLLPEIHAPEATAAEYHKPLMRKPTPPGSILDAFFIKPMGLKQLEIANHMNVAAPRLNRILQNKGPLTADTALRLQAALRVPADFWLTLQSRYEAWHEINNRGQDYLDIAPLAARVPTSQAYIDEHDIPSAIDIDASFGPTIAHIPV